MQVRREPSAVVDRPPRTVPMVPTPSASLPARREGANNNNTDPQALTAVSLAAGYAGKRRPELLRDPKVPPEWLLGEIREAGRRLEQHNDEGSRPAEPVPSDGTNQRDQRLVWV